MSKERITVEAQTIIAANKCTYAPNFFSNEQLDKNKELALKGADEFVNRIWGWCMNNEELVQKRDGINIMSFSLPGIGDLQLNYLGNQMFAIYDDCRKHGYPKYMSLFVREDGSIDTLSFILEIFREFNWTTTPFEED